MFDYARSDTHFLLYIYDIMHNELVQNNDLSEPDGDLIDKVLKGSKAYQLQRYENPIYDAENGMGHIGWYKQLFKTPALLSKLQFSVYKAVHHWRDATARREDESLFYIMSNNTLMTIAREMPTTKEHLFGITSAVTPPMRQHVQDLVDTIARAKETGVDGPEMREALAKLDVIADTMHNSRFSYEKPVSLSGALAQVRKEARAATPPAVEQVVAAKTLTGPVVLESVKAESSGFWGSTLKKVTGQRNYSTDVRLALPMPDVTAEVFAYEGTPVKAVATPATPVIDSSPVVQRKDDVFTIRDMGGKSKKRKVDAVEDTPSQIGLSQTEMEFEDGLKGANSALHDLKEEKAEAWRLQEAERLLKMAPTMAREAAALRKEQRKYDQEQAAGKGFAPPPASSFPSRSLKPEVEGAPLSKREKKRQRLEIEKGVQASLSAESEPMADQAEDGDAVLASLDAPEEALDYAGAANVLTGAGKKDKKKRKKGRMDGFDHYAKGLDAPKGLPRVQKERAGKSQTFMS